MDQKKIAGVCAGFARYFDCDVTLMRVMWLVIAFGTGIGFVVYHRVDRHAEGIREHVQ